jgi:Family of unknown function (DUF6152)
MKKSSLLVLTIVLMVLAAGITAYAHHSFTATYLEHKTMKIEGKVVQFLMRNPHSFIHVEAPDENGKVQTWSIEGGGASQMRDKNGVALKIGDHVIVTANPGRSAEAHRGRLISITRPSDGWAWGNLPGQVVD